MTFKDYKELAERAKAAVRMKCNNTHCKYYVKAKKDLFAKMMGLGTLTTDGGCKYSYCKKKKKWMR